MEPVAYLREIRKGIDSGDQFATTVRDLLFRFGAYRRGYWIVNSIRIALAEAHLQTEPDFESAYIDSEIKFVPEEDGASGATLPPSSQSTLTTVIPQTGDTAALEVSYGDPTYRLSKLSAANNPPKSVAPDAPIAEAVTSMLSNDYSQLPVMTSDREVKGIVSWTSIGCRLALGKPGECVRDLMDQHQEIRADASLFSAIAIIVDHQYVLVRGSDNRITGIVTASDLNLQFRQLAEPFLLLGEVENHIRRIIANKFQTGDLAAAKDPSDSNRKVESVADLTFGEYVRLLENHDRWMQLGLGIDRAMFVSKLEKVRGIRNDVMHFDPDGIAEDDFRELQEFATFLRRLQSIGVL